MKKAKQIELGSDEVQALRERLSQKSLEETDYGTLTSMLENLLFLRQAYEEKSISIKRLLRMLFGHSTESSRNLFGSEKQKGNRRPSGKGKRRKWKKAKGHGRNGKEAYAGAGKVVTPLADLRPGDHCPGCLKGKVYKSVKPGVLLRFTASVPVEATIYEQEKLRCNLCNEIFTAPTPKEAGPEKYDETVGAMIAVLKYGYGFPFYRIEKLQESVGIPLAASTQYEIVLGTSEKVSPAHEELIRQGAQGRVIHNDDTVMKVLSLMNLQDCPDGETPPERTGLFTTGILSVKDERRIALYFTGRNHAGENLEELLKQRESDRGPPIQMCDALSRNLPKTFQTILANCMSHGRRNFVDVSANWPQECEYVIKMLGKVYHVDDIAKKEGLTPADRLCLHQSRSGPVMEELKMWMEEQFEQKKVEPNSGLGKAIKYMMNHWEPLTLFLRVEGAPLHNNLCEQALKRAVLHRKNALFFKTQRGAQVGDLFMSVVHTCNLTGANPFEYLIALQVHHEDVRNNPGLWMPWNYKNRIPTDCSS